MMGLEPELVEEAPEESARRESEAALEVRDKDNPFSGSHVGLGFTARDPTLHLRRNAPSQLQPINLGLADVRSLPSTAFSGSLFLGNVGRLRGISGRHLGRINLQEVREITGGEHISVFTVKKRGN